MTLLSEQAAPNKSGPSYPVARYARHDAYFRAHDLQTPCLLLDLDMVAEHYRALREALPGADVYYAVKAGAAPELLRLLVRLGCGFDVASTGEIDMCLAAGADPELLSFGNTVKKHAAIEDAWRRGVKLFAFDSPEELTKIAAAAPGASVVCRITVETTGAQWPISRKFGCGEPERAVELLVKAHRLGLRPKALTFHVGSQQREPENWDIGISRCATVTRELAAHGIEIELLNLGGGLPSRYDDALPRLTAYADAIHASLARHYPRAPRLIIEPGRYLPGDAGLIRSEVVLATTRGAGAGKRWVYVDIGRFGGLAETEGEAIRFPLIALRGGRLLGSQVSPAVLAGPTCDSADVLYEHAPRRLPVDLTAGDQLDFLATGAYTAPYCSVGFNGFEPLRTYCFEG